MQATLELVKGMYDDFAAGDIPGILRRFAPDAKWVEPEGIPWGGSKHGARAIEDFFAALDAVAIVEEFAPREFIVGDGMVAVCGAERLRSKTTGRTYKAEWVHVFRISGGKIVEFREYTDTAEIQAAFAPRH